MKVNRRSFVRWAATVIVGLGSTLGAAGSAADEMASEEQAGWEFGLVPYLWMASLKGDLATISELPAVDVDASFPDIFEKTGFAFMLAAEARRERLGLVADFTYMELSADGDPPGPLFSDVDIENATFLGTLAPFYRVFENDRVWLDVLAGIRIWSIETDLKLAPGIAAGRSIEDQETWVDPLIGGRGSVQLWGPILLSSAFDIGGFGAASDLAWQVIGTLDYRFSKRLLFRAGYRHVDVDYEDGGFEFDVAMSGAILGAVVGF